MKLAEALIIRAETMKHISQLSERLRDNALVQEGEKPEENPAELLNILQLEIGELELLIYRINHTNNQTSSPEAQSIMLLLAKRDALTLYVSVLRSFISRSSQRFERNSAREIRIESAIDTTKLRIMLDSKSKELRELEMKIQQLNWTTDLL